MKKIFIAFLAVGFMAFVSCKKSSTQNDGSWLFKGTTYTVTSSIANVSTDSSLVCVSKGNNTYNTLQFYFRELPVANGSYLVVQGAPDSTLTQVGIEMKLTTGSQFIGPTYEVSAANNGIMAAVTIVNGEIKITLPAVDMYNPADSTGADHGALTATVNQNGPLE